MYKWNKSKLIFLSEWYFNIYWLVHYCWKIHNNCYRPNLSLRTLLAWKIEPDNSFFIFKFYFLARLKGTVFGTCSFGKITEIKIIHVNFLQSAFWIELLQFDEYFLVISVELNLAVFLSKMPKLVWMHLWQFWQVAIGAIFCILLKWFPGCHLTFRCLNIDQDLLFWKEMEKNAFSSNWIFFLNSK